MISHDYDQLVIDTVNYIHYIVVYCPETHIQFNNIEPLENIVNT